ncbi:NAD-P-binding protein [Mycena maculata]|uniref:NAD-P-binding protein n=1 Tax=Mycena maculata TaxID=230809 RepID=A0AAD7JSP9_9AGAR|nr:NAD-P-binding protein [Mycena maculata]
MPSRGVVLITGINGFIGTYTALAFLDAGYTVRGTARTADRAKDWITHFPAHKAAYEYAEVPDFVAPGAFNNAIKGCDIIVHVASPINTPTEKVDNEAYFLVPAVRGTRNLLEATKLEPRIRRVVFTGTLGTVVGSAELDPTKLYTENDWNGATYEEAKASTEPRFVYRASKTLAERAFWDYIAQEKPAWAGAAILPCGVFDPPIQPLSALAAMNRSVAFWWNIANGKFKGGLDASAQHAIRHAGYVSARDVALAHLRAAERDAAKNKRYLLIAGNCGLAEIVEIIQRNFPAFRDNLPTPGSEDQAPLAKFDTSKTQSELGIEFMSLEKVLVDTIASVAALEKQLGS